MNAKQVVAVVEGMLREYTKPAPRSPLDNRPLPKFEDNWFGYHFMPELKRRVGIK